ncbi:uncharacterized protein [Euphorbia lathyris]|uniref:uncharacterized protein n=1 Tax=Euphorbia lathyris TaxID=212925 RepID=UPI003313DCDB
MEILRSFRHALSGSKPSSILHAPIHDRPRPSGDHLKPTGLRLPAPRLGYFDGFAQNHQNMKNHADTLQHRAKQSSASGHIFDLRKSMAWDSVFDGPGVLDPQELFDILHIQVVDNRPDVDSRSRKSLDWDSAFFTSADLLDDDELAIVNRGFKRRDCNGNAASSTAKPERKKGKPDPHPHLI